MPEAREPRVLLGFFDHQALWLLAKEIPGGFNGKNPLYTNIWLVVLTILKNISQWEGLSHILWKIKNV